MAIEAKHPHIRVDERIWDDPVMVEISSDAFRSYFFAIAWSKSQSGRTPDGLLTPHGIRIIGATLESVQELLDRKLIEKCNGGYKILKYEEWQMTSEEERERQAYKANRSEIAKTAATKRWSKPPVEEGFDADAAFEQAWGEWPEPSESRYTEKRDEAIEAFRENIRSSKDFALFSAALLKRVRTYQHETGTKADRRRFLGAFKNFCADRWKDWIPKSKVEAPLVSITPPAENAVAKVENPYAVGDEEFQKLQPTH
jgi:hypothetical protein